MSFGLQFLLFCICAFSINLTCSQPSNSTTEDPCIPNQVHISLGDAYYNTLSSNPEVNSNASAFVVWQTQDLCNNTYLSLNASSTNFSLEISPDEIWYEMINATVEAEDNPDGKDGTYTSYSHTAILKDLDPSIIYTYSILQTNSSNITGPFQLKLPQLSNESNNTRLVVYGDIDTSSDNYTVNALKEIAQKDPFAFDFQLLLGDVGYEIYSENGKRGEYFFNTAQPFLTAWPFMITAGNHDGYLNFTFLNFRNRMPLYNKTANQYYSFNVGKMHLVGINYDFYARNPPLQERMLQWVEDDLKAANANRVERPWIIVFTHRPVYCSHSDPNFPENKRCYYFSKYYKIWGDLYEKYNVDIVLQAHIHYWERMGPVYQNKSAKYSSWSKNDRAHIIINPQGPIYTIEGSGGNNYSMITNPTPPAEYSLNYDTNIGYSTLSMVNESAFYYEHIKSSDGTVIDYFYLLKGSQYVTPEEPEQREEPGFAALPWIIGGSCVAVLLLVVVGVILYRRFKKKRRHFRYEGEEVEIGAR